jgi:hypothetical protein
LFYNKLIKIKFVYFLIYLIKFLNVNNKIRFLSNIIQPNRVKGPKTDSAPELKEFKKDAYKIEEINLLLKVLTNKFQLICYKLKDNNGNYVIRIISKSLLTLQNLLKNVIPNSMKYKIGL